MRFDDTLRTVLAIETSTPFGAISAWRQLVDLIGRGRVPANDEVIARLRAIRPRVPEAARTASARALAFASPGAELVALFAEEDLPVSAPVLRTATLPADAWTTLLPQLSPAQRSVLRHRRDLPAAAVRGLESYGSVDFVLGHDGAQAIAEEAQAVTRAEDAAAPAEPVPEPTSVVALADVARERAGEAGQPPVDPTPVPNGYPISDLVERLEAFQRAREGAPLAADEAPVAPERFRFETDALGTIRWVDGIERAPLIGISLQLGEGAAPHVDGVAAGAFRRRAPFRDARLTIAGASPAAGSWRIAGTPVFDPRSGRFAGYRGSGRRPRADEAAAPRSAAADSLRQLVHELRTPTNAIAGFAELMEREMLGPVPQPYRERAAAIRQEAAGLVAAIEDLDTAARIEGDALELRDGAVSLARLLATTLADLGPLIRQRGARLVLAPVPAGLTVLADERAVERLVGRLLTVLVSASAPDERLSVTAMRESEARALLVLSRPAALRQADEGGLLSIDAEHEADAPGAPLLGTGFALRLAQNLATELGGGLAIEAERLTLRLPAAVTSEMGQASTR